MPFERLCSVKDLEPGEAQRFDLGKLRIALVRIEPRRDQEQFGRILVEHRKEELAERGLVDRVRRAVGQRHVHRVPGAVPGAELIGGAGAGIERPLVQRAEQHPRIVPEDVLRAVAVVHVEVDHRHPREPAAQRRLRRHASWEELPAPQGPSFQIDLQARELAARAIRVIDSLPVSDRSLLTAYWFSPATAETIAAESGCSTITVRRRILRARTRFERLARRDPALARCIDDARVSSRRWGQAPVDMF